MSGERRNTKAILSSLNIEAGCNPNNVGFLPGLGWRRQRVEVNQYYWNAGRALPPDGNPIGGVNHFQQTDSGGWTIQPFFYPPALSYNPSGFALYDRWADAKLDKSEFVGVQTARSLATAAWLAAQSSANVNQSWSAADTAAATGTIGFPNGDPTLGVPAIATLTSGTLDLLSARTVWEPDGSQPHLGSSVTVERNTVGESRIEAEAALPDGRRVFAVTSYLVNDPVHGGSEDDTVDPNNTIALYHFTDNLNDSTSHHYNLIASGSAAFVANPFSDNTTWMRVRSGKVVRFTSVDDSLDIGTIADSWVLPANGATLTIEFEIYPRAYLGSANIFALIEKDSIPGEFDQDARWVISGASAPEVYGPYWWQDNPPISPTILDAAGWSQLVPLNTWHAIKITLDSNGRTTLFIDGS